MPPWRFHVELSFIFDLVGDGDILLKSVIVEFCNGFISGGFIQKIKKPRNKKGPFQRVQAAQLGFPALFEMVLLNFEASIKSP